MGAEPLTRHILEQARGNPLFLEHLAHAAGRGDGRQPGAPLSLLELATGDAPGLRAQLDELDTLDLVREEPGTARPVYVVSHPLAREVVYESLPPAEREALHAGAGLALEAVHAGRLQDVLEPLAYHASRAGDPRKAIEHLARFAEASLAGHALAEAAEALREALDHADRLPSPGRERSRVETVLRLAVALSGLGRSGEVLDLLSGERENVERLHEPRLTGPYYCRLALAHAYLGDHEGARAAARRAVGEAARCGDEPIIRAIGFAYGVGLAERNLGRLALAAGTYAEAATHLGTARALFAGMGSRHEVARTVLAQAALAHARGDTAQAAALLDEARAAFQALGMPALVARAEQLARDWAAPRGDDAGVQLAPVA